MDNAIPFAAVLIVLGVIAGGMWPQRTLLAIVLGMAGLIVLVVRAVELA